VPREAEVAISHDADWRSNRDWDVAVQRSKALNVNASLIQRPLDRPRTYLAKFRRLRQARVNTPGETANPRAADGRGGALLGHLSALEVAGRVLGMQMRNASVSPVPRGSR
jgi:hypothetical protein